MKTLIKKNSILRHLEHLDLAQKQRTDHQQRYILSKKGSREIDLNLNNHPVEMNSVKANVTLSFDFTQMVHYPNTSDQVGCLHFKVPRKCSLFGVVKRRFGYASNVPH